MSEFPHPGLDRFDRNVTRWMARVGPGLLRISLGLVFLWFGALKLIPGLSPAETLATDTIGWLTGGMIEPALALPVLALWETLIGVLLVLGRGLRIAIFLLLLQMPGTILPLFVYPELTFRVVPFVPTLEGQYIIKNLVLVSAALVVGATVRGGRLDRAPEA